MNNRALVGGSIAIALAAAIWGYTAFSNPSSYRYGPGMMGGYGPGTMSSYGPGMMGGYGPGMMGGYGPGFMHRFGDGSGPGWFGRSADLNLSSDDVKNYFERWIALQDNPRIKLGEIKEADGGTIQVDIVTQDNSLVQRFIVNRRTGGYRQSGG